MKQSIPISLSVFAYGVVFGVLSRQTGLNPGQALMMSGLVFAGSSQLIALDMWRIPLPVLPIIFTTLVVNLRYILMGAALFRWFSRLSKPKAYLSLFFMTDENWALTMAEYSTGKKSGGFLLGSGFTIFIAWMASTALGQIAGGVFDQPERWGLDFAFTAVFLSLVIGMYRGKRDWLPWLVAAGTAVLFSRVLPGKWYILLGALAGSLVGVGLGDE